MTIAAAAAALLSGTLQPVAAGSASANLTVTATVTNNCSISTAAVAFGAYDPIIANASADLDSTGAVTVTCTRGATATVALDRGSNAAGPARQLKDTGTNVLAYELFQDAGRSAVWGNAGAALLSAGAAPSKAPRTFTVYGRISGGQDVPAGNYSDTVVATVNF
jgi:spore coat protein U-like protein